eukprot:1971784-Lingulodinium_polyedra.AAC.1
MSSSASSSVSKGNKRSKAQPSRMAGVHGILHESALNDLMDYIKEHPERVYPLLQLAKAKWDTNPNDGEEMFHETYRKLY